MRKLERSGSPEQGEAESKDPEPLEINQMRRYLRTKTENSKKFLFLCIQALTIFEPPKIPEFSHETRRSA
jgi:hypothetical protein